MPTLNREQMIDIEDQKTTERESEAYNNISCAMAELCPQDKWSDEEREESKLYCLSETKILVTPEVQAKLEVLNHAELYSALWEVLKDTRR